MKFNLWFKTNSIKVLIVKFRQLQQYSTTMLSFLKVDFALKERLNLTKTQSKWKRKDDHERDYMM